MKALKYEEKYEYSNKIDILTPAIKGTSWSVPFLIGTQFNKRFDLFGSYALIPGVNEGVYHEAKRIRVGVNYHFGKQ